MALTLLGFEGFEVGETPPGWTFSGRTVNAAAPRTGAYNVYGSSEQQYAEHVLDANVTNMFALGFGFKTNARGQGFPSILYVYDSAGNIIFGLGNQDTDPAGTIRIMDATHSYGNTVDHVATALLPSGSWTSGWFFVECLLNVSTGAVILRVDGQEIYNATIDLDDGNANISYFRLYVPRNTQTHHDDVYWGEGVGLTAADLLGPGTRIFPLAVTADGADDGVWVPSAGSDAYAMVDETPDDADVTYIEETTGTAGLKQSFTVEDLISSVDVVHAVRVRTHARYESVNPSSVRQYVKVGGTDYPGNDHVLAAAYAAFDYDWYLNPDDAAAWEPADVNGLEVGIETRTP